jgi:hypothetical protein
MGLHRFGLYSHLTHNVNVKSSLDTPNKLHCFMDLIFVQKALIISSAAPVIALAQQHEMPVLNLFNSVNHAPHAFYILRVKFNK